jgi:hypothetical protein
MDSLCAVVPIGRDFQDYASMKSWIRISISKGIYVVLVRDSFETSQIADFDRTFGLEVKSPFVTVLDGDFQSPGLARNFGLGKSNQTWVTFWDCDDIPNPTNVWLAICNVDKGVDAIIGQFSVNGTRKGTQNMIDLAYAPSHWRIVYRRSLIQNSRFRSFMWGEDQLFILESGLLSSKVHVSQLEFYDYKVGLSNQLTSKIAYASELKKVLREFHKIISANETSLDVRIPSVLMATRLSITLAKVAIKYPKIDLFAFAVYMQFRLLFQFRITFIRVVFQIINRKLIKA